MGSRNVHTHSPLTRELYIPTVMFRTCAIHDAGKHVPCFSVPNMARKGVFHDGVCNDRAKQAGMNGEISHSSLFFIRKVPPRVRNDGK